MTETTIRPWKLRAILIVFAALGILYSATMPIFEASDEVWHYPMVEVIARTGQLPVQPLEPGQTSGPWRQEGSQPPLYYALGAALTFWIDTGDMAEVRHLNPHVKAGEATPERSNVNLVVHDPTIEGLPWTGTVLAVHLVRVLSVALGTWAVYLTWALVTELFPTRPWLALTTAAVHAFTPMYLFISSSVNNDNLIVPLATLTLLLIVRRVKAPGRMSGNASLLPYVAIGAVLGLGLLTKASAIALIPFAGAALAWETWRLPRGTKVARRAAFFVVRLVAFVVPAIAISGWWFYRNYRLYEDWLGLNAFYAVLGTRDVPASFIQLWSERFAFAAGYWGNFGGLNVPFPHWIYTVLNGLAIVAAVGLLLRLGLWLANGLGVVRRPRSNDTDRAESPLRQLWPFTWDDITAARVLAWMWPCAVLVSWARWATVTWSSQGRLIFSAIPLWSLALVLGWTAWMPQRRSRYGAGLAATGALFLAILSTAALPLIILPAYRPPDDRTGNVSSTFTLTDATFGQALRLVGYRLSTQQLQPGESVELELLWTATGTTPTDHSIFIHILGEGDRIIAQRDSFPARGLVSTTQLQAGDGWRERYLIALPTTAYAPDRLEVAVGLYETATGERLPRVDSGTPTGSDTIHFGEIALVPRDEGLGNQIDVRFGPGIALTGYELSDLVVSSGGSLEVTLSWLCTAPLPTDYTISVQLIDAHWNKAGQSDSWPLDGEAPTSAWKTGRTIEERRTLEIGPDAVPGTYDLRLAIYYVDESGDLVHLPVRLSNDTMATKSVVLTTIRVR
jgi:4-amino-4-deoxy-L-arabinose transferase-like glycosyltransferase